MIEAKVATNLFGAESIGGGLCPEELAKRERRVREARAKPRYCENSECRVLKLTGERQRLRGLNSMIVDTGAYQSVQPSRLCSWCIQAGVEQPKEKRKSPQTSWKRPDLLKEQCVNGHDIAEVGRYKSGECCQCHKEANLRRYYRRKAKRETS